MRRYQGSATLEYAFLIAILVAGLIGLTIYFRNALAGKWRDSYDSAFGHGHQYAPGITKETELP